MDWMPLLMIGPAILSGLAVQGKVTGIFESYPLSMPICMHLCFSELELYCLMTPKNYKIK